MGSKLVQKIIRHEFVPEYNSIMGINSDGDIVVDVYKTMPPIEVTINFPTVILPFKVNFECI